jgi:hypothetical protein
MSAGTLVIAWRNGSVPEVVAEGVSGMIVESIEEAVASVDRVRTLSRASVRHHFETHFTAGRMARDYIAAYGRLLEDAGLDRRMRQWAGRLPERHLPPRQASKPPLGSVEKAQERPTFAV